MNSCRTNRPHMSRRERHLLAMLYRLNYQDYEKFNLPVGSRKEPPRKSRKKELLVQWSAILTELGVSRREPDELASKISQYKNIVKNHKLCKREVSWRLSYFYITVFFSLLVTRADIRGILGPATDTVSSYPNLLHSGNQRPVHEKRVQAAESSTSTVSHHENV